ncbi:MAG: 4-hydroxy-tetrahydrodipicolinate synthase, partial [Euryarchaeota archaeon]|nr:4-hydroxy-tetrahydrodipicolinate synthase [Euryarchaeota archaeon]
GTGSNCTWEALELSRYAEDVGADATLQVCPYYNKPNQEGLFRHFSAIAEKVEIPHILYNIPGRSAQSIAPETMARLKEEHSNIVGVKEASGKREVWREVRRLCGSDFVILSGNDGDTLELMREHSAKGVVSVASNLIPARMQRFVELGLKGSFSEMEREHEEL